MTADRPDSRPARSTPPTSSRARSPRAPFRGRPVSVLGFARSGIALARFLADAGADVTVYDARPADGAGRRDRVARGADGPAPARARRRPRRRARRRRARRHVAVDQRRLPDDRAAPPRRAPRTSSTAGRGGDASAPAIVSEVDLFLRLCPAPTIGITGTKGKTTTSALTHALLATDHDHPAVLGGNIGTPLVERLPELTPRHRVVVELSELQLPTLSPRDDGRGVHERHLRPPRPARDARGVPRGQAPARGARRPGGRPRPERWTTRSSRATRTRPPRASSGTGAASCPPGGLGRGARLARRGRDRSRSTIAADRAARRSRADGSCPSPSSALAGCAQRLERPGGGGGRAPVRRSTRRRSGVRPRHFDGRRAPPRARRGDRRRPLRQRLAGHPAGRGHRGAARVRRARSC